MSVSTRFAAALGVLMMAMMAVAFWVSPAAAEIIVDQAEICLACHDDVASEVALPVQHSPAEQGDCLSCHNPHAARDAALLLKKPAILVAVMGKDDDIAALWEWTSSNRLTRYVVPPGAVPSDLCPQF